MNEPGKDREEYARKQRRNIRIIITLAAIGLTIGFGAFTPSAPPTAGSRIILAGFTFSLLFAFVTIIALIPAPPDPRRFIIRRLRGPSLEDKPESSLEEQQSRSLMNKALSEVDDPRRRRG